MHFLPRQHVNRPCILHQPLIRPHGEHRILPAVVDTYAAHTGTIRQRVQIRLSGVANDFKGLQDHIGSKLADLLLDGLVVQRVHLEPAGPGAIRVTGQERFPDDALLLTGRRSEIGGGASHIVNISLKIRVTDDVLCLPEYGFVAPGLNDSPLMECQGTE